MKLISLKTFIEVLASISINLTSAWLGILVVAPGFIGVHNLNEYLQSLTVNGLFGMVGLIVSLGLMQLSKNV